MKRIIHSVLIIVLLLFSSSLALAQGNRGAKVPVCHFDRDSGIYHLININENAYDAHVDHGDASPGDSVPDMEGYEFDDDCSIVAVTCVIVLTDFVATFLGISKEQTVPLSLINRGISTYNDFVWEGGGSFYQLRIIIQISPTITRRSLVWNSFNGWSNDSVASTTCPEPV